MTDKKIDYSKLNWSDNFDVHITRIGPFELVVQNNKFMVDIVHTYDKTVTNLVNIHTSSIEYSSSEEAKIKAVEWVNKFIDNLNEIKEKHLTK